MVNPEEAELVKIIYQKYVYEDMGLDTLASFFNERGYKKKKNRKCELDYFTRGMIKNILDNPVYVGKIAYGKNVTEKVKGTRDEYRRVKSDEYLLADGIHDAIIDEELWMTTRVKRKATGVKWNKTHSLEHEHILSGIIKCPICGTGLSGTVRRRKNKKTGDYVDDFYYRCQHRHKIDDEHFCNFQPSLNQDEFNHEIEQVILDMVNHDGFRKFVEEKLNTKVDVSALEEERERIRKLLRQVLGAKTKLTDMLDKLDVMDKHYDRKYQDMHDRLDNLYDKISEYEDSIADITARIEAVYGNQITGKQIYDILVHFEMMYYKMTDLEKKEFMKDFINSIELYPEKMDNGSIVKQINFKFGVYYEGQETMDIRLLNERTVECVVGMQRKHM